MKEEPNGMFWVEIKTWNPENRGWDLWADAVDWHEALKEYDVVKAHNFDARILDSNGDVVKE